MQKKQFKDLSAKERSAMEYLDDGRVPIEDLYDSFDELVETDLFVRALVCMQEVVLDASTKLTFPIYSYATPLPASITKGSPSILILSGVHGEEPSGPIAISQSLNSFVSLAEEGCRLVIIPLLNPAGYLRNWRYENQAQYNPLVVGQSVTDSDHVILNADKTSARQDVSGKTAMQNVAAILQYVKKYQFDFSLDLHEDQLLPRGGYIYSQGKERRDQTIARQIVADLVSAGMPVHPDAPTRFPGEFIKDGIVTSNGNDLVMDGSIDELLGLSEYFANGTVQHKHAVPHVFVTELPTSGELGKLSLRVAVYKKLLQFPKFKDS